MDNVSVIMKVFFEEPFWIGIIEVCSSNHFSTCKITFGSEPKDYEIKEFIMKDYYSLKFSMPLKCEAKSDSKVINPKRMQRSIRKQLENIQIGTKSQNALKLQHEQLKKEHSDISKQKKEAKKMYKFELKQAKRLAKHKGR